MRIWYLRCHFITSKSCLAWMKKWLDFLRLRSFGFVELVLGVSLLASNWTQSLSAPSPGSVLSANSQSLRQENCSHLTLYVQDIIFLGCGPHLPKHSGNWVDVDHVPALMSHSMEPRLSLSWIISLSEYLAKQVLALYVPQHLFRAKKCAFVFVTSCGFGSLSGFFCSKCCIWNIGLTIIKQVFKPFKS